MEKKLERAINELAKVSIKKNAGYATEWKKYLKAGGSRTMINSNISKSKDFGARVIYYKKTKK